MNWKNMSTVQRSILIAGILGIIVYAVLTYMNILDVAHDLDTLRFASFGITWLALAILAQDKRVKIFHYIVAGLYLFTSLYSILIG